MKMFSGGKREREEARLKSFIADNLALQNDLQVIQARAGEIQKIYAVKLKSCVSANKNMEDIVNSFFLHEGEYYATYKEFNIGSHNDPVSDARHRLNYDMAVNEFLDRILLRAAEQSNLNLNAFRKEISTRLRWFTGA